ASTPRGSGTPSASTRGAGAGCGTCGGPEARATGTKASGRSRSWLARLSTTVEPTPATSTTAATASAFSDPHAAGAVSAASAARLVAAINSRGTAVSIASAAANTAGTVRP